MPNRAYYSPPPVACTNVQGDVIAFLATMIGLPQRSDEIQGQRRVLTLAAAVKYINACGFCMLFATKNVSLPSLYHAVTRRTLHREDWVWDKYSSMVWRWK